MRAVHRGRMSAPPLDPVRGVAEAAARTDAVVFGTLAFFGSGCLLVLEIVAGRLLAPTLGVSLYTWTSVIGVVLAGVSLGNFLGGRLADRWPSRSALALVYVAASLASVVILVLVRYVESLQLPTGAPAVVQVLWLTTVMFFIPSTCMAAATPLLTRLSLRTVAEGGRVVGRIQAAAALGSIVGTFLTGFYLISAFGTRRIVAGVAVTLLVLAVASRPPWLRRGAVVLGSVLAVILALGWKSHGRCFRESNYYCIRVEDRVQADSTSYNAPVRHLRGLYLDRLLHGIVDVRDPSYLYYGYERLYARAIETLHPRGTSVEAFFMGGGSYTFPRWLDRFYRGRIVVAEIDPEVTRVVRTYFGLDRATRIETRSADARRVLREMPAAERYDLALGDAFNDFEVPFHLTTRQFNELVARHLRPDGLYLANVIDSVHFDFLRSELRTLRLTFPYVGLMADPEDWPVTRNDRATYVVVAAKRAPRTPLPVLPARQVDDFVAHGHGVVLTDDHAPTDQLLAPVFSQALEGRG
jgi:predicted membrane-bound spermidine synthase